MECTPNITYSNLTHSNVTFSNLTSCSNSSNSSVQTNGRRFVDIDLLFAMYFKATFAAGIYYSVVAPLTVLANSLLLYVLFRNSSRSLKNPATDFLVGLSLADILTALISEPCYCYCFIRMYLKGIRHKATREMCNRVIFNVARASGSTTVNISFLTVLMFTFVQYLVLVSPMKIAPRITRQKIIVCQVILWVYSILFQAAIFMGPVERLLHAEIDMYLHSMTVTVLSLVLYGLIYRTFRRRMAHHRRLRSESHHEVNRNQKRQIKTERRFVFINFLLITIMIVTSLPNTGFWFARVYLNLKMSPDTMAIQALTDCALFLKFLLNPFVYAWRFSKYRAALWEVFCCGKREERIEGATEMTTASLSVARQSTSNVTLVSVTQTDPL